MHAAPLPARSRPPILWLVAALGLTLGFALAGCPAKVAVEPPDPAPPAPPLGRSCDVPSAAVPVLPRTSNDEVRQIVADLLGEPVDAALFARWTPLAQVRGFDTLTESRIDAQTLEEQLLTMEAVAKLLVQSPSVMAACPAPQQQEPLCALHGSYDATAQFSGEQGRDCWSYLDGNGALLTFRQADQLWTANDPGLSIWNTGLHPGIGVDVVRRWTAPLDGAATLSGTVADADAGGGDGIGVVIRAPTGNVFRAVIVNGGSAETFDIPLQVRRGDVVDIVVERGGTNAYDSTALTATISFAPAPATAGLTWDNCGRVVVERITGRAWRRPVRAAELADLQTVFSEASTSATTAGLPGAFDEGLEAALQAALMSPHVHYKPELVPGGFDPAEDQFRIASRLGFFFRGSIPDDELWAAASAGGLGSDEDIAAQAERLLAVDADRFVQGFAGQWLDFRPALGATSTPLALSMRKEAHDVFAAVLAAGLPAQRLLAPGFTIVDAPLAAHYGLAAEPDPVTGLARVETTERGGLFTQGHFLTSTATGSNFKRVIHRGIWAMSRTLCRPLPMLDAATREEINASVGQIDPALPLADQMELHRNTSERCLACHSMMDPPGLALENFDEQGLWRDTYADGSPIDNSFDLDGTSVRNPSELSAFVEGSEEFRRCVAEKLLTFGLYRAPRNEEGCVVDGLLDRDDAGTRSLHDITIDAFLASLRLTEER